MRKDHVVLIFNSKANGLDTGLILMLSRDHSLVVAGHSNGSTLSVIGPESRSSRVYMVDNTVEQVADILREAFK